MYQIQNMVLFSLLLLSFNSNIFAKERVIYGEDNRMELKDAPTFYQDLAKPTAGMVKIVNLINDRDSDFVKLKGKSFKDHNSLCPGERFENELSGVGCSGFLVAPDVLVTAGHCIQDMDACNSRVWIFDYANFETTDVRIPKKNIYGCKEIISQKLNPLGDQQDFSVIRLDRPVIDREPLEFRREGKIDDNDLVLAIGHPSGLPTKITDNAKIRKNSNKYFFQTNLDTFAGNSGSAVFNQKTGLVEGILVRGEVDFSFDFWNWCNRVSKCTETGCRGEDVIRITIIEALLSL